MSVNLRKKTLGTGRISLYLDFYPAIRNPDTGVFTRRQFLKLYLLDKPKSDLERETNRKTYLLAQNVCALCRCRVSVGTSFSNLEHMIGKTPYPQFQFHTPNLVYSCTRCNLVKNKIQALAAPAAIKANQTFPTTTNGFKIVNPYFDNYEDHIDFLDQVIVVVANNSSKGEETIKSYNLSRVDLAEERAYQLKLDGDSLSKALVARLTDAALSQDTIDQINAVIAAAPNWVLED